MLFEVANIAHEIKKEEQEVYREFLKHISNVDTVDVEKIMRLIPDSSILRYMNDDSFEQWRIKLFHTNLTFFDWAIERAKAGKMGESTIEAQYLNEIDRSITRLNKQVEFLTENL